MEQATVLNTYIVRREAPVKLPLSQDASLSRSAGIADLQGEEGDALASIVALKEVL